MFGENVHSETLTERLLESMGTALLVFDARMQLSYINHAGEVMFAHSARHACGRSVQELVINAAVLADQLSSSLVSEQVVSHRGCLLELPDAPDLRVNCTFTSITDNRGEPCVLVELRKIDYQLRIEQEEHLITQQQATHELVRGLAHEINTPLTGISSFAQMLGEMTSEDDPRSSIVAKLVDQSFRVSRIVSNLRAMVRDSADSRMVLDMGTIAVRAAQDAARSLGAEDKLEVS